MSAKEAQRMRVWAEAVGEDAGRNRTCVGP